MIASYPGWPVIMEMNNGMKPRTHSDSGLLKSIGPGILFAGAAIGGSHLVQSTKAGAIYGLSLVVVVLLANLFKYPFFEFCRRYTAATGESALYGYKQLGSWALWTFLVISVFSGFINIAAVTVVTGAIAAKLFAADLSIFWWAAISAGFCVGLLITGRYPTLDSFMKFILVVLAISTVVAFTAAVINGPQSVPDFEPPPLWNAGGIAFMIALMGWMPTPIDAAVWPSLWALERTKQTGHRPSLKETLFDFNLGYIGTAVLALFFLGLGALVMYGTGETPEAKGIPFAHQLISMYTRTLGQWAYYFIAAAAFTCMLSTTITCFDGYTRSIHGSLSIIRGEKEYRPNGGFYWTIMAVFFASTLLVTGLLMSTMGDLVNLAMIIAFLTAPIVGFINYRLIKSKNVPEQFRIPGWLNLLAQVGLVFLIGFAVLFLVSQVLW